MGNGQSHGTPNRRTVFGVLWLWRWRVLGSALICTAIGTALAFLMTPVYRASVLLAPAPGQGTSAVNSALGHLGGIASLVGLNVGSATADTQVAIAVLKSREFTDAFINQNNLMPQLFAKDWNARLARWRGPADTWPTENKAYKYFDEKIRDVSMDRHSGFVTLSIEWRNRIEAAQWANQMVAQLNAEMRDRAIRQAKSDILYLEQALKATESVEVHAALNELIAEQLRQEMVASATPEYSFRVIDRAVPPDSNDPARPKKVLTILAALIAGLAIPCLIAVIVVSGSESVSQN